MKQALTLGIFSFFSISSFAQSGEVTNAILAQKDGMLLDAKTSIDKASEHEKTKNDTKTWYYKGKIYEAIALDPTLGKQNSDAAKIAFDSYTKAQQLDETAEKPGKYKKDLTEAFASQSLAVAIQNGGIQAYQDKKLSDAYDYFTIYQTIKPLDTLGYVYAAQMALAKDDYKNAKEAYTKGMTKTGYISPEILTNLLYIYKTVESEKDLNKALEIARLGKSKYPNNANFVNQEVDILEKSGKLTEAITNLESIIQKGDKKVENYLLLGSLYEKNKELDKAKESYRSALAVNPNSFEANYNMGALIYNPAVDIIKTVRNMGVSDYQKKGKQMEAQAKEVIKISLPYFEKAYEVKSNDFTTKKTLKEIYASLGMTDKANALK
ncbi:MAG: hypothetical protein H7329_06795 [Opitutaceae bacterium]|nr:hypothetical protein [Cytophagales bacterium]